MKWLRNVDWKRVFSLTVICIVLICLAVMIPNAVADLLT